MDSLAEERMFYHALAVSLEGNYHALARLAKKHPDRTWKERHTAVKHGGASVVDAQTQWQKLEALGIRLLLSRDDEFPPLLREIPWPPFGLYVRGALPLHTDTCLAIVGTRNATHEGKNVARRFAHDLSAAGLTIVSGLALGVDAASHEGTLEARGKTIAVVAHGLDRIYPRTNASLATRIVGNGGAIVSEYPPGTESFPSHFLERNRIVSGLSKGTLIIEAPETSGTLATARFAFEQNRDVFVVPGPVSHPNFKGSHELIRGGATLVADPSHILESLGFSAPRAPEKIPAETPEEACILDALGRASAPLHIDKLIELTKLNTQIANQTLTLLLLKERVREHPDGYSI